MKDLTRGQLAFVLGVIGGFIWVVVQLASQ
jgi:flagellar biogenesis protein FliO